MTTNNWRAPERVGSKIGLSDEELSQFLQTVRKVHREKADSTGNRYDLSQDYFEFLNNEVFSDRRVFNQLNQIGVDDTTISSFKEGEVDIEGAFHSHNRFKYRLDELVDFVMMIKLVRDYLNQSDGSWIEPKDNLHYLVYLVNHELKNREVHFSRNQRTDLGMLEFTGYRYTFRRQANGPHSSRLERDKDRLFAWDLLHQEVTQDYDPNEYQPFRIQLGHSGGLLTMRYKSRFDSLHAGGSELLREWSYCQREVLERFGQMDCDELRNYVTSLDEYQNTIEGRVVLTGRPRFFEPEEDSPISTISGGMLHA